MIDKYVTHFIFPTNTLPYRTSKGFYNDHHFHQGYHIYAAAAVAELDPDWGKKYFEQVLLLIRDFAK